MIILVLVVIILLFSSYIYYNDIKEFLYIVKKVHVFPGTKGYPLIGNILEILGPAEDKFRKLSVYVNETSHNGVTAAWMCHLPFIIITEPTVIERVLKNPVHNKKGLIYKIVHPWLDEGLLTSHGDKWQTRRKLLSQAFHFNFLQKCVLTFNEKGRALIDTVKKRCHIELDVLPILSHYTLDIILDTTMGKSLEEEREEGEKYLSSVQEFGVLIIDRIMKTWLMVDFIHRLTENYLRQRQLLPILHRFTERAISERKHSFRMNTETNRIDEITSDSHTGKTVFLDSLISAQMRGDNIDDKGIREEMDTLIFAGHDTTSLSLCYTLMLLANNKKCQDKIYEEILSVLGNDDRDPTNSDLQNMKYLECCIKESLRLYPSAPKISRRMGEDVTLDNGHVIPKNCTILILIYEMHRRADLFPNPETFDPDRFSLENSLNRHPCAFLPFSFGPRNCIGQKYAMMEMKCLIAAVIRNFILQPVDTPETIQVVLDMVLRTKNPIRVKFIPRINIHE